MAHLDYNDTSNAIYDIQNPKYLDADSMWNEAQRSFEVCEGCRLCFKYCTTFPKIFDLIEGTSGNSITEVPIAQLDEPVSECFQCKLCYVKCPYTDKDEHDYVLDLPALFTRWQAIRRKRSFGPKAIRDWMLSRPVFIGKLGGLMPFLFNFMNRNVLNRFMMHLTIGIHRHKTLPKVHWKSFMKRFKKMKQTTLLNPGEADKVALFPTCYVNYNEPSIGEDAVFVLNQNGKEVSCRSGNCCGAPQLDIPNFDRARDWARKVIVAHADDVAAGRPILALNPTCSMTMRKEYPHLFPEGEEREKAKKFASQVKDYHEYLWELKQEEKLNRDFKSTPGGTDYHAACHLRAQGIGFRSRDILRLIPENPITFTDECSCHDGTFAFKKEFYDTSMKYGSTAFKALAAKPNKLKTTDCPLAGMQLQEGMKSEERPVHPVQILAKAYREDGFDKKVPPPEA